MAENNHIINFESYFISLEEAEEQLKYCNSYDRLPTLLSLNSRIDTDDWARLLGNHWVGCDNIGLHMDELFNTLYLQYDLPICQMMTDEEQAEFDALPDLVTVYRGCYAVNKWGLSWSLSEDVALAFPTLNRYQMSTQPLLVKAVAKKEAIVALKLEREEFEVITYRPKHVSTRYIRKV